MVKPPQWTWFWQKAGVKGNAETLIWWLNDVIAVECCKQGFSSCFIIFHCSRLRFSWLFCSLNSPIFKESPGSWSWSSSCRISSNPVVLLAPAKPTTNPLVHRQISMDFGKCRVNLEDFDWCWMILDDGGSVFRWFWMMLVIFPQVF